ARTFPWGMGRDVDLPNTFLNQADTRARPKSVPVGSAPVDVSPFGIHDMAGSAVEACVDAYGAIRGQSAVCGGSSASYDFGDITSTSVVARSNEAAADLGFRIVCRPPAIQRSAAKRGVHDDFNRPDGPELGGDWMKCVGVPTTFPRIQPSMAICGIEAGSLVCRGTEGSFSWASSAYHSVQMGKVGLTVRAQFSTSSKPGHPGGRVWISSNVDSQAGMRVTLRTASNGALIFQAYCHGAGASHEELYVEDVIDGIAGVLNVDLTLRGKAVELRVWAEGQPRPQQSLALDLQEAFEGDVFFGVSAVQNSECQMALHDVKFTALDE
ncbi:MAG: hypothetical protein ACI9F9_002860, partial [Candidatus Paceibacteria bacterium]